jgi:hypothetical protein
MDTKTQLVHGYYVWEIPGKSVAVHLHLDVVDRILADVMRGFSAVPKRGAEVGGVLLGRIEHGDRSVVYVEDFQSVACAYKRGPSFLLTGGDLKAFADACDANSANVVGFFRSHTRDGMALGSEDLELLDRHFPEAAQIALLIRPYGTKVSAAGFFFRENGSFQESTPLEFPFRRRELAGEEAPLPRRMREPETRIVPPAAAVVDTGSRAPAASKLRNGWIWVPVSFIFLLLGLLLGFQAAQTMNARASSADTEHFTLGLMVSKVDENLSVKWDRQAAAVRASQRGVLEIEDGTYPAKPVDLDSAQLQNGSILYRPSSGRVRFRLVVYPQARLSVTETMEWKR